MNRRIRGDALGEEELQKAGGAIEIKTCERPYKAATDQVPY